MIPYRDDNPRILVPYVTYAVVTINAAVFLLEMGGGEEFIRWFGIVPALAEIDLLHYAFTLFTSMFLHGGIAHIGGNMLYLWIFGDNIEGILGHGKFLVFYLLCGIAAGLVQTFINPASDVPIIGASGAIAGVLGAYMITFPRARIHTLIPFFYFMQTVRIPALYVLGFWFLIQLTNGLGTLGIDTTGGVAWFAHIGGFLTGIASIRILKGLHR